LTNVRVPLDGDNTISLDTLKEFSFQVAGAVSAVFLSKHPLEVMPTQEVAAAVYYILSEFDFKE
jgi:hypothetical protein